jgi:hypothetical protein
MREVTVLNDGDIVVVEGRSGTFTVGTVSGYAAKYGEGHLAADRIETTIRRNQRVTWLNANATVISDPPTPRPEIDAYLKDGEVVIVKSPYSAETGYWIVQHPGWADGDNCQLVRPEHVYEVWDNNVGKDSFTMLLAAEIPDHLAFMLADNPGCSINIIAHAPNEYRQR